MFGTLITPQPRKNTLGRKRQFAKTHPGRIKDGVGNRRGAWDRRGFANAERRLILPGQHQHVDLWNIREGDDGVGAPFAAGHRVAVERDLFHQRAAGRLDDVAVDLVADAVGVDHQAGILTGDHAGYTDIAGRLVDGDIGNPGRPRGAVARKLAVNVQRVGKAPSAHDVALRDRLLPDRARGPVRSLGNRVDKVNRTGIPEIAKAIFNGIDAGFGGQFVDIGFVGEGIRQRRHATKPGCAHDRRHVVRHHADGVVVVRRDRGAVAHLEHFWCRRNRARQQQRERRRAVGRIACGKIVTGDAAVGAQSALDVHQLRRALWLPGVLLFARQLHPDRTADRARQKNGIGGDVVGAVAAIAAGRLHPDHLDFGFRPLQQQREVGAQDVGILRAGPDPYVPFLIIRDSAGRTDRAVHLVWPDVSPLHRLCGRGEGGVDVAFVDQGPRCRRMGAECGLDVLHIGQRRRRLPNHFELRRRLDRVFLTLGDDADEIADRDDGD